MNPFVVIIPSPASLSHIGIRIAIVAAALGIWFWTQALIGRKKKAEEGIGDRIHELTAGLHQSLLIHPRRADALLLLSSFFIDLFGLALIGFAVFGPSLGPLIALMIVFALRQICQSITTLPPPPGIIWRSPGFPSLLVTYGVSNDLFFSGHTTLAVLGAIEAVHLAPAWVGVAAAIIAVFEAVVVVVLRAHYTLDVVTGALAAYWASEMARILAPGIDAWLATLG